MPRSPEWVAAKDYGRWSFPIPDKFPSGESGAAQREDKKGKKPKNKVEASPSQAPQPTVREASENQPAEPPSRARPHPGKAGELGPGGPKDLVPLSQADRGRVRVPKGPSRPHGGPEAPMLEGRPQSRTIQQQEEGQAALAAMVVGVLAGRQSRYADKRNAIGAGDTVEIDRSGRTMPDPGRSRRDPVTAEIKTDSETTTPLRPYRANPYEQTIDFDAIPSAKRVLAVREPLPIGSNRTGQLPLFHVPGSDVNPSVSTRQMEPIPMSGGSARPGQRVTKLAARVTPGKKPGDQGTLFQPARYRSVT